MFQGELSICRELKTFNLLLQIWHAGTALLAAACRGHEEEVTDLATNTSNDLLASSSNDKSIRVWSLQVPGSSPSREQDLGLNVQSRLLASLSNNSFVRALLAADSECLGFMECQI